MGVTGRESSAGVGGAGGDGGEGDTTCGSFEVAVERDCRNEPGFGHQGDTGRIPFLVCLTRPRSFGTWRTVCLSHVLLEVISYSACGVWFLVAVFPMQTTSERREKRRDTSASSKGGSVSGAAQGRANEQCLLLATWKCVRRPSA